MVNFEVEGDRPKAPAIGAMNLVLITMIIAILGIVCFFAKVWLGSCIFGGMGLLLGGYSMGYSHKHAAKNIKVLFAISGAALLISVFAFMFGFLGLAQ